MTDTEWKNLMRGTEWENTKPPTDPETMAEQPEQPEKRQIFGTAELTCLLLITFPPVGITYMWFKAPWQPVTKAIITVVWACLLVYIFAGALSPAPTTPYGY